MQLSKSILVHSQASNMIDLFERKALQDTVMVGGSAFPIDTDFRVWIRFVNEYENWDKKGTIDISYLFTDKENLPEFNTRSDYNGIFEFAYPRNGCPHSEGSGSTERILDYRIDSDYIYAAFLSQYCINLITVEDLHYHVFKALLNGISKPTRLYEIMGYRSYRGKDKDMQRIKQAWSLPEIETEEEKEAEREFNDYFG